MKWIIFFFIVLFYSTSFAQRARDYFFPAPGKNKMVFGMPDTKDLPKNQMKTHVFFKDKGDSAVITTKYFDGQVFTESWEQVVRVEDFEISIIKEKSNKSNETQIFGAKEFIVFKMPSPNGKVEWTHPKQSGSMVETFESEYATVNIDGSQRKAVKVTTKINKKHSGKHVMSYIDYFVEGIGRYKRTDEAGTVVEILEDQK